MRIEVEGLSKKFGREWIFRDLSTSFNSNKSYAITGHNGSGKSTFLQVLAGFIPTNKGVINFYQDDNLISGEDIFQEIDLITPYLELIEEFTLSEFVSFHFSFKKIASGLSEDEFLAKVMLEKEHNKFIKHFSSGMKQRLKLGLAFFSESSICLLDEPTNNLDTKGIDWYRKHVDEILKSKLILISSNQKHEYDFCDQILHIPDFKVKKTEKSR